MESGHRSALRGAAGRELGWGSQQGQDTAVAPTSQPVRGVRGMQRQTAAPGTSVPRELAGELDTDQAGQPLLEGRGDTKVQAPSPGQWALEGRRRVGVGRGGSLSSCRGNPEAGAQLSTFLGSFIGSFRRDCRPRGQAFLSMPDLPAPPEPACSGTWVCAGSAGCYVPGRKPACALPSAPASALSGTCGDQQEVGAQRW